MTTSRPLEYKFLHFFFSPRVSIPSKSSLLLAETKLCNPLVCEAHTIRSGRGKKGHSSICTAAAAAILHSDYLFLLLPLLSRLSGDRGDILYFVPNICWSWGEGDIFSVSYSCNLQGTFVEFHNARRQMDYEKKSYAFEPITWSE